MVIMRCLWGHDLRILCCYVLFSVVLALMGSEGFVENTMWNDVFCILWYLLVMGDYVL